MQKKQNNPKTNNSPQNFIQDNLMDTKNLDNLVSTNVIQIIFSPIIKKKNKKKFYKIINKFKKRMLLLFKWWLEIKSFLFKRNP